jgi:hypothetical protein
MPASDARAFKIADFEFPGCSPASRGSKQIMIFNVGIRGAILRRVGIWRRVVITHTREAWLMMYSVVSGPKVS